MGEQNGQSQSLFAQILVRRADFEYDNAKSLLYSGQTGQYGAFRR